MAGEQKICSNEALKMACLLNLSLHLHFSQYLLENKKPIAPTTQQDKTQIPYVFLKPNPAYFTTLIPPKLSETFYSPSTLIFPDYAHAYLPFLFMPFFGLSFHSVRMMNL